MAAVVTSQEGAILSVRLNRPEKLNAMNSELLDGVLAALTTAVSDDTVKVVVLSGTGRAFCAGGDLTVTLAERQAAKANTVTMAMKTVQIFSLMEWLPKPVICMVNGLTYAGGMGFPLYSDLTLAADSAVFCCPQATRGLYEPYTATRLGNRVGVERAKYILLTARKFTAAEALSWGLISEVHPLGQLEAATMTMAGQLAKNSASSMAEYKQTFRRSQPDFDLAAFLNEVAGSGVTEVMERFAADFPAKGQDG
jgi:enoyl-CoA hydratase/carnithine racemase